MIIYIYIYIYPDNLTPHEEGRLKNNYFFGKFYFIIIIKWTTKKI